MFEQSPASSSPLYLTSWEINKLFDSLRKNSFLFGWRHLGLPVHIADLLVSLDENDIPLSVPYTLNIDWARSAARV